MKEATENYVKELEKHLNESIKKSKYSLATRICEQIESANYISFLIDKN